MTLAPRPSPPQTAKRGADGFRTGSDSFGGLTRRRWLEASATMAGLLTLDGLPLLHAADAKPRGVEVKDLPVGDAPKPLAFSHFPNRLYAYVWRNWQLTPIGRIARAIDAEVEQIQRLASDLGLVSPLPITSDQLQRSYVTIIRQNWHLLPYEQLLSLLGWTPEKLLYTLRYDDAVYNKFGSLKPDCEPLQWTEPTAAERAQARQFATILQTDTLHKLVRTEQPLFDFVRQLSAPPQRTPAAPERGASRLTPRFCYSYFTPYGDPLLDPSADPYPEGYLARLAEAGVDGVWLHGMLSKLAAFPWDDGEGNQHEQRLANLKALVARAKRYGVGIYLYLNEPRALSARFFDAHPELKGYDGYRPWELGTATLCTSVPQVRNYLRSATQQICTAVEDLAGFFTITASESLTNCWCHRGGDRCPRCKSREPAEVIAEVNQTYYEGIQAAKSSARLIVWDWGWDETWISSIVDRLPPGADFMSASEWELPIERGGVESRIYEYSLSAVGPGPRATRNWGLARQRGLRTIAKIQVNCTWELSAIPYLPVVANVAQHAANLRDAGVNGIMMSWTLGGYPSPNFAVADAIGRDAALTPEGAMQQVAKRQFGASLAPAIVEAWRAFSSAFGEFPFGEGLYFAPIQYGPSNLLWPAPTHYATGTVAFPYDDLANWRGQYSPEAFIGQLDKVVQGFELALNQLRSATDHGESIPAEQRQALDEQLILAEAAMIHFRSAANQCRFVHSRDQLAQKTVAVDRSALLTSLETILRQESADARRLAELQSMDSRIGFEASNHYYYVPLDLGEKILNCHHLMEHWLPELRRTASGS